MVGVITLLDQPRTLDALGRPTSATIFFYLTGTTTLANIYSDEDLLIPAANPVVLSSGQIFPDIYLDSETTYRRRIVYGDGTIHDIDPYPVGLTAEILAAPTGASLIGTEYGPLNEVLDSLLDPTITSISVGAGGTFTTLVAALDWLKLQPLIRPMTVNLLERNTPDTDTGSMAIPATGYTFFHVNSRNVYFEGPAFGAGQGTIANGSLTGDKATDLAYCKSRYPASIRINGTDDAAASNAGGLSFPNGCGGFKRILFEERSRYSLDFGYNRSHLNARGGSPTSFEDCAFFGSVWGVIGYGAHFAWVGQNWFGYQVDGGAIGNFDGSQEFVVNGTGQLRFYQPSAAAAASGPKYTVYVDGGYFELNTDSVASGIVIDGSWLHGLYAINGAAGDFRGAVFNGVTQPFTIGNASVNITGFSITGADPTKTAAVPGSLQPGVPGNSVAGALISVGSGGSVQQNGGTISNSVCNAYVFCNGGNIRGYGTIAVSDSKATTSAWRFAASKGNVLSGSITTPQAGSLDQSQCSQNGDIFWFNSSGFTFSPALNTPTNGSGNYN